MAKKKTDEKTEIEQAPTTDTEPEPTEVQTGGGAKTGDTSPEGPAAPPPTGPPATTPPATPTAPTPTQNP